VPNLTFTSLASSSRGNAYVVEGGDITLLLECGLPIKELQKRLGYRLSQVTACLVSHEHQDHAHSAAQLLKYGIPVYMSEGTAAAHKAPMDKAYLVKSGDTLTFGALRVRAFSTFHNTAEPLGWIIWDTRTEECMLFAIDTANLNVIVDGLTMVCVECNYEEKLLQQDVYPTWLTERIRKSHFELEHLVQYLHKLDLSKVRKIWLLHLSLRHTNIRSILVRFAQEFPGIPVEICSG